MVTLWIFIISLLACIVLGVPIAFSLVPCLINSVRYFGNLTFETDDVLMRPWLKVLCD